MNKRIYLIGFMGSGKSTFGKKLAKELALPFIDLDKEIEVKAKCSITDIFKYLGEDTFRKMESDTLHELSDREEFVMATGGGTPCYFNNIEQINNNGTSIYIELDIQSIYNRLSQAKNIRPTIKDKKEEELLQFIKEKIEERKPIYEKADLIINGLSVNLKEVVSKLI
ncbi:MAG: shikimate kinase [bacterium]